MHQYSWRLRLQNQVRPVSSVRCERLLVHPADHQDLAGRLLLHDRGDEAVGVERDGVDLGLGVRDRRRDGGRGHARQRSRRTVERRLPIAPGPFRFARSHDSRPRETRDHAANDRRRRAIAPRSRTSSAPTATNASTTGTGCATATTPTCSRTSRPRTRTPTRSCGRPKALQTRSSTRSAPGAGDRHVGAGARRPVGVLPPHRRGPPVRDPLPAAARGGGDEADRARRERARRGPRLLRARRPRDRPDHAIRAYTVDTTGGERYTLRFRDLATGRRPRRRRRRRLLRPRLGRRQPHVLLRAPRRRDAAVPGLAPHARHAAPTTTSLVFQEDDERFFVVPRAAAAAARFVLIDRSRSTTSEAWFVPTAAPETRRRAIVAARRDGVEYRVEHSTQRHRRPVLIVTNADGAENFKLVTALVAEPGRRALDRGRPAPRRTCASTASTRSPTTSCSPSAPTAVSGSGCCASRDGASTRSAARGCRVSVWLGANPEFDTHDDPLRLHVARRARHRLRLRPRARASARS